MSHLQGSPPGQNEHDPASHTANMIRTAAAEFVGTFLLVLVGTGVATAAALGQNTAGPAYDSFAIAFSFGLVLTAVVASLAQVSGAHVNPAVTIAMAVIGKFPWRYVPAYVVAQISGAIVASLAVWAGYGGPARSKALLGAPAPTPESTLLQGLTIEILIAFLLVFVIVAVATDERVPAGSAPLAVGFALAAGVLIAGPISGGAANPARALGPMIVAGTFPAVAIYVIGPIIGAVLAAVLYHRFIAGGDAPKVGIADQPAMPSRCNLIGLVSARRCGSPWRCPPPAAPAARRGSAGPRRGRTPVGPARE